MGIIYYKKNKGLKMSKKNFPKLSFHKNSVTHSNDNTYYNFSPFIEYISDFATSIGGTSKWCGDSLVIYHKDFYNFHSKRLPDNAYVDLLTLTEAQNEDFDLEFDSQFNIKNIKDVEEVITNIVTADVDKKSLYTQEELDLTKAKKTLANYENNIRFEKEKKFKEELKTLRISEDEFLNLLELYPN